VRLLAFIAETTALIPAVAMFSSIPTPQRVAPFPSEVST
jgi:hypothetical protein